MHQNIKDQSKMLNKEKEKRAARMEEERNERRRREKEEKLLKKAEKEQRQQQKKMKKQVRLQATKRAAPVFNAGAAMFVASVPVLAISTRLGFFNPVLDTFGKVKAMLASSSDAREQSSSIRDEASSSSSSSSSEPWRLKTPEVFAAMTQPLGSLNTNATATNAQPSSSMSSSPPS